MAAGRRLRTRVRTTKARPTHFVIFASFESSVIAFECVKKVSAAPEMAPESPERLPDWSSTTQIKNRQVISWIIVRAVVIVFCPFNEKEVSLYNSYSCKANNNTIMKSFQEIFNI